jgi:hypothetical protein
MQEDEECLSRRRFLRLGGTGIAVTGAAASMPRGQSQPPKPKTQPSPAVHLRSKHMDATLGLPISYLLGGSGLRFSGAVSSSPLLATVCCRYTSTIICRHSCSPILAAKR